MEIEADGSSVAAEDCLAFARIFEDQLGMFINFDEPKEVVEKTSNEPEFNKNLLRRSGRIRIVRKINELFKDVILFISVI